MVPIEILILMIIINTLAILERILRNRGIYKVIHDRIVNRKKKLAESIKSASQSITDNTDLFNFTDLVDTIDDFDGMVDIFENLVFNVPK